MMLESEIERERISSQERVMAQQESQISKNRPGGSLSE
jgi:hypothetical protein